MHSHRVTLVCVVCHSITSPPDKTISFRRLGHAHCGGDRFPVSDRDTGFGKYIGTPPQVNSANGKPNYGWSLDVSGCDGVALGRFENDKLDGRGPTFPGSETHARVRRARNVTASLWIRLWLKRLAAWRGDASDGDVRRDRVRRTYGGTKRNCDGWVGSLVAALFSFRAWTDSNCSNGCRCRGERKFRHPHRP